MTDRRHYVVLGITVFAVLVFGLFVLRPRASQAADLQQQISEAEAGERSLQDHLQTLLDASVRRKEFEAEVAKIEGLLPRFPHLVRTIRLLHKASLQAGVDLREIAPSNPTAHIAVPNAQTIATTLIIEGTYDRVEAFINRLEDLDRAMQLLGWTLTPSQEGNRTVLSAALTTEMYLFDPDAPAGSVPAPAAASTPVPEATP